MKKAKMGDRVRVQYIGTLDNGRIFDQRDDRDPLVFTLGSGEIFPALEQEVLGMRVGEVKNIHLPAQQAFGPRCEENLLKVKRSLFPTGRTLKTGEKLKIELGGHEQRVMRVRAIDDDGVLLDGNHELSGCDLTFALQLVAIETVSD